jgi:hypothetical protein
MKDEKGYRAVVIAVTGAVAVFCIVAVGIFYRVANVRVNGWIHGGPTMLAGGMAGLFGGGLAGLVMLMMLLRGKKRG